MPLGLNTLQQFVLPTYWDAATLEKYRLRDGTTLDALMSDIAGALSIANGDLLSDPVVNSLISVTTDLTLEYRVGVSNGFEEHTEFTRPNASRGAVSGHMLPLKGYDRMLGWSWDFLRFASRSQIDADIASAIGDQKNLFQQKIFTRFFNSAYEAVGAAGRSMPFADGGTADPAFVPLAVSDRGGTFLSTHDHIVALNGITQANVVAGIRNLWEHGVNGPWDILVADADIGTWTDNTVITGYIPRADPLVRYGVTADMASVDPGYTGVIDTIYGAARLRSTGRFPTGYWGIYKSYGALDQRNPLAVRFGTDYGAGATIVKGASIVEYPIENAIIFLEFGVGVKDRIGAVAVQNTAGAYADPTIL